ncbi:hypothetical protein QFC20_003228 [Naganishia adeliensis]|uniref:Uncharacterized protein n=1 Tax=Naganishia adeliensis TaxID=92952 RepID=A0ACC2WFG5_9TREE|nr:hypothetical protein QFC20_003228 [Naganishia adeliensis]
MAKALTAAQAASAEHDFELWQQRYWKRIVAKQLAEAKRAARRRRQKEALLAARPAATELSEAEKDSRSQVVGYVDVQEQRTTDTQATQGKVFQGAESLICPTSRHGNEATGDESSSPHSTQGFQSASAPMTVPLSALSAKAASMRGDLHDILDQEEGCRWVLGVMILFYIASRSNVNFTHNTSRKAAGD